MVQKKIPLINSAHGSDTRNIINELIKLFNSMGYTYDEALQKAHDVLDEAQQTNDMNESVQRQINILIAESGTSDAEVLQARVDFAGRPHDVLKGRLDNTDNRVSDISVSVKDFGAVGDGVSDDTSAIQAAFDALINGDTLLIPHNHTFNISDHINMTGKDNITIVMKGKINDLGKDIETIAGSRITPVGMSFNNCNNLTIHKLENISPSNASSAVTDEAISERVPLVDFVGCDNLTLYQPTPTGFVGPYYTLNKGVADLMRATFFRFLDCNMIDIVSLNIPVNTGSGDTLCFYRCNGINFHKFNIDHRTASNTFWTLANMILCNNVKIYDSQGFSRSTGSMFDVAGSNIRFENVHMDYPNGPFVDVTSEWEPALINDGVDDFKTDVHFDNCTANDIPVYAVGSGTVTKEKKLTVDNFKTLNKGFTTERFQEAYIKNVDFEDISQPVINRVFSNGSNSFDRDITLDNVKIFYNESNGSIDNHGELKIKNSVFNLNERYFTFNDAKAGLKYINGTLSDLSEATDIIVVENTEFKNGHLRFGSNVKFINCKFTDVTFMQGPAEKDKKPLLHFIDSDILYTNKFSITRQVLNFATSEYRLILDNTKMTGTVKHDYVVKPIFNTIGNNTTVEIINGSIVDIRGESGVELNYFLTSRNTNGNYTFKESELLNGTVIKAINGSSNLNMDTFNIQKTTFTGGTQIDFSEITTSAVRGNINMNVVMSKFDAPYLTALERNSEDFNTFKNGGNIEV